MNKMKIDSVIIYFVVEEAWHFSSGQVSFNNNNNNNNNSSSSSSNNMTKLKPVIYLSNILYRKSNFEKHRKNLRRCIFFYFFC